MRLDLRNYRDQGFDLCAILMDGRGHSVMKAELLQSTWGSFLTRETRLMVSCKRLNGSKAGSKIGQFGSKSISCF